MALLALGLLVAVSSRARTTQEANQLGGAVILPLIFLAAGYASVLLLVPVLSVFGVGVVIWAVALALLARNGRRFTRDRLATACLSQASGRGSLLREDDQLQEGGAEDGDQQHGQGDGGALPHRRTSCRAGRDELHGRDRRRGRRPPARRRSPRCSTAVPTWSPRRSAAEWRSDGHRQQAVGVDHQPDLTGGDLGVAGGPAGRAPIVADAQPHPVAEVGHLGRDPR